MIKYQIPFKKILIILLLFYTPIYAEHKFYVQNICIHGLHRISIITALINFPIRVGDNIYIEDINNSIRALFSTNNFDNVQILRDANTLIVQLKERPIISFMKVLDNHIINKNTLLRFFSELDIYPGQIFNRTKLYLIEQKIQSYYYSIGYYNVSVKMRIISLPNHMVGIIISFKEGKPAQIEKIRILGHKAFSYRELSHNFMLRDKLQLSLYDRVINNNRHQYQKKILYQDLEKLREFYFSHGYANFKIFYAEVNLTPNKEKIFITINIREGLRYKIKKVIFKGNFFINKKEKRKLFFLKNEEWYNLKKVQILEKCLRNLLQTYGYIWPSIYINEIINKDNTINIIVNINTGQRYYVHRIYFRGNHITQDPVLRREIAQREGKWFNEDLVEKGKNRLYKTGFFKTVSINVQRVPTILNSVDIIYQLKEQEYKGNINLGLGWDGAKHLSYHIKILHSNWLGTADTMAFGIKKSNDSSQSHLTIINPHFSIKGFRISKDIFLKNLYNYEISKYQHKSYGFNDDIAIPISQYNFINIGIGYANNDISNIQPQINVWNYLRYQGISPDLLSKIKYTESNFNLKTGWTYNSLNQKLFPTYGIKNKILSTIYFPFPISFWKINNKIYYLITLDSMGYITIPIINHNKWAILGHGHIGYTSTFIKKSSPFFESFFGGGINYLRGFSINSIGTRAIYYNSIRYFCKKKTQPICLSQDGIGGNLITVASIELLAPIINPIIHHSSLGTMRASIFFDMGTVILVKSDWKNPFTKKNNEMTNNYINSNNIRISTGINLQWISPFGPVIAVYSKPIKKDHADKVDSFQFSFGTNW
ncbi:MAG: outer membrane protein assembly factor BamA [Candidatus Dasytiphilus stammeri]